MCTSFRSRNRGTRTGKASESFLSVTRGCRGFRRTIRRPDESSRRILQIISKTPLIRILTDSSSPVLLIPVAKPDLLLTHRKHRTELKLAASSFSPDSAILPVYGRRWPDPDRFRVPPPMPSLLPEPPVVRPHLLAQGSDSGTVASSMDSNITLWQFLLELLLSGECPHLIQWTNQQGEFKLLNAEEVARLWGVRKNKPNMNYDKLSRALRYYYDKNIIKKVVGQKFVYRFVSFPENARSEMMAYALRLSHQAKVLQAAQQMPALQRLPSPVKRPVSTDSEEPALTPPNSDGAPANDLSSYSGAGDNLPMDLSRRSQTADTPPPSGSDPVSPASSSSSGHHQSASSSVIVQPESKKRKLSDFLPKEEADDDGWSSMPAISFSSSISRPVKPKPKPRPLNLATPPLSLSCGQPVAALASPLFTPFLNPFQNLYAALLSGGACVGGRSPASPLTPSASAAFPFPPPSASMLPPLTPLTPSSAAALFSPALLTPAAMSAASLLSMAMASGVSMAPPSAGLFSTGSIFSFPSQTTTKTEKSSSAHLRSPPINNS